jgi:hypothetical protein
MFLIDGNNNLKLHDSKVAGALLPVGAGFATERDLATLAAHWPATRLVEIWNRLPGVKRVRRFRDRKTGVERIWKTIRNLRKARQPVQTNLPRRTKTERILAHLNKPSGATLNALMALTGWQAHSVRGFLSQLSKKRGLRIQSFQRNGERVYRTPS